MKLKLLGSIMLIVFSVYFGFTEIKRMRLRINTLASLGSLLSRIKRRIECFCEPLASIYASFDDELLYELGFIGALRHSGLAAAVNTLDSLTETEKRTMLEFEKKLSEYYPDEAVKLCDAVLKSISDALDDANTVFAPRAKLYKALPPLGAVALILLMM